MKYQRNYGTGYHTVPPNYDHCAALVPNGGRSVGFHQCLNTARYDPDEDGNPTTCGIHCEAAVTKRDEAAKARHDAQRRRIENRRARRESPNDPETLNATHRFVVFAHHPLSLQRSTSGRIYVSLQEAVQYAGGIPDTYYVRIIERNMDSASLRYYDRSGTLLGERQGGETYWTYGKGDSW